MRGTENCVYETPCGWYSKWDKKCDKKAPERGQLLIRYIRWRMLLKCGIVEKRGWIDDKL